MRRQETEMCRVWFTLHFNMHNHRQASEVKTATFVNPELVNPHLSLKGTVPW